MRLCGAAAAVAVLGLASRGALASPEDLFGYGARTNAMGATGTAHATDGEAAWHNPALASRIRKSALTIGWQDAVYALPVDAEAARGALVGAGIPIPFGGALHDRVGLTLGFYTPSDVVVRGRVLYPEKPQYPLLVDRAQSVTIRAGIGVDVGWGLRAGAGIAALAELSGKVVAAASGTEVDDRLVATYAPAFGLSWEKGEYRIGAVFRGRLDARFDVTVDGSKLTSLPIPVFDISGLAQFDPAQVALEIARSSDDGVVAVQVAYKRWSDFPGLLAPTVVCSDGSTSCGLQPPAIDWKDTFAVRVGAERGLALAPGATLKLRAGGWVESSALPDRLPASPAFGGPVPTRYYDGTRIVPTIGAGIALRQLDVDLFAQEHVVVKEGRITVFGLTGTVRF
jgi:long-chain fatty acid transport protein